MRNTPLIAPHEDSFGNLRLDTRHKISQCRAALNILENYINAEPEPFRSTTPDWAETNFLRYDMASAVGHAFSWLQEAIDNERNIRKIHQTYTPPDDGEQTARLRRKW